MKKFWKKYYWLNTSLLWIICIISAYLINSCTTQVIQEGNTQTEHIINHANFKYIREFTYKNHDYIMFETYGNYSATAGIVHNPECKYCKHDTICIRN